MDTSNDMNRELKEILSDMIKSYNMPFPEDYGPLESVNRVYDFRGYEVKLTLTKKEME